MTSTAYQGRHWKAEVKARMNEPSLLWLFLTTFIPSYIYDLQKNRKNFRIKFGYLPLFLFVLTTSIIVGETVGWQDLAISLVTKKFSYS
jgi:hypothetical protein